MGTAARVYAEQLAKFEFGHALYWPEPTKALNGQFHEPEIGDVGYIDEDGAFQVLFNVSHSADHQSHAGPPPFPGNFVPLDYDRNLVETKERFCTIGPLYSSGVRSQRMQGLISAYADRFLKLCPVLILIYAEVTYRTCQRVARYRIASSAVGNRVPSSCSGTMRPKR